MRLWQKERHSSVITFALKITKQEVEVVSNGKNYYATWLLNNPNLTMMEIGKISERLGHESKKITLDIYYHLVKNADDSNILSALL